jgi:hypothetical protein
VENGSKLIILNRKTTNMRRTNHLKSIPLGQVRGEPLKILW